MLESGLGQEAQITAKARGSNQGKGKMLELGLGQDARIRGRARG